MKTSEVLFPALHSKLLQANYLELQQWKRKEILEECVLDLTSLRENDHWSLFHAWRFCL